MAVDVGELADFLVRAKRRTYAAGGDASSVTPTIPGSKQLEFDPLSSSSYLGTSSGGTESGPLDWMSGTVFGPLRRSVVRFPYHQMSGGTFSGPRDGFSGTFSMPPPISLVRIPGHHPFRGPNSSPK